jgi:preprotein translocase subunit YajC
MISNILSAFWDQYGMLIFLGVLLVGMFAFNIVSNKKKNKQRQDTLNQIGVGTKILTIGGMYGKVVEISSDNKLVVDVGNGAKETLIVFDRQSVRTVVSGYAANAGSQTPAAGEKEGGDKA